MNFSRFQGAVALVSTIALAVGCTALGGRDEEPVPQRRGPGPISIEIPQSSTGPSEDDECDLQSGKTLCDEVRRLNKETERGRLAGYPPNCDTQCRKAWDKMWAWRPPTEVAPAAPAASTAQGVCPTARPKPVAKKKSKQPVCGTTAAVVAPTASAVVQSPLPLDVAELVRMAPAASAPAFKLTDPVTERQLSKEIGAYSVWNIFGYRDGLLVHRPYVGANKAVFMRQQQHDFIYTCSQLRVPETDRDLRVKVTAVVNPSLNWEPDYHRLVAIYGATSGKHIDTNTVSAEDVIAGAKIYVGQHQDALCRAAATKSLDDLLRDPSLGAAQDLNRYFHRDVRAHFEVLVQLTEVDLTKEDYRVIGLKARTKP